MTGLKRKFIMKNKYNSILFSCLMALSYIAVMPETAHAAIFKCVDKQGATYYNDKSCPAEDEETKLKAIKDPKNSNKFSYSVIEKKDKRKFAAGDIAKNSITKNTRNTQSETKKLKLTNKLGSNNNKGGFSSSSSSSRAKNTSVTIVSNGSSLVRKKGANSSASSKPPTLPE